jgi:hypothetical protein
MSDNGRATGHRDAAIQKIVARSQFASLLGLACLIAVFAYGSYKLYRLRSEIQSARQTLQALHAQEQNLLDVANGALHSSGPITGIVPRASAVPIPDKKTPEGTAYYLFRCWLDLSAVPDTDKQRIQSITYLFDDPTMPNRTPTSTTPPDYAYEYDGWGAFRVVPITVNLKDGTNFTIYFNMFKAIGW